ncbi:MAG: hypothetical protein SGPRY_005949, partial [Prymnesium sp.]
MKATLAGASYEYEADAPQHPHQPPLPEGWRVALAHDGRNFYVNEWTGERAYERPTLKNEMGMRVAMRSLFARYDSDGDGCLTIDELRRLLEF